ncbi:MAG: hypothetical protein LBT50_01320 [Prevotellaceae bacterium]|nr:hypothetical protein [Prevotellaceae bacterium]
MFDAKLPAEINCVGYHYEGKLSNLQNAFDKLVQFGGISEEDVLTKIKKHLINGEWEGQKNGLINALSGAKIKGKIIDDKKLSRIIENAMDFQYFQFEKSSTKF